MPSDSSQEYFLSLLLLILLGKEKSNVRQPLLTEMILWWCHPWPSAVL